MAIRNLCRLAQLGSAWLCLAAMAAEGATYGPLRIPELRWLCQQRGLTPYGRKRELLSRLEEQDQQEEVSMWRKISVFLCVFCGFTGM